VAQSATVSEMTNVKKSNDGIEKRSGNDVAAISVAKKYVAYLSVMWHRQTYQRDETS